MKNSAKRSMAAGALFASSVVATITQAATYEYIDDQFNPAKWVAVEMIGAHTGLAFVRFQSGANVIPPAAPATLPNGVNCLNGLFYIDITATHGRLIYQQLLLAKNTGKKMSRVGYTQDTANAICMLWLTAQIE